MGRSPPEATGLRVSRRVSFRPEAEAEALETRDWYEGRRPGLGAEFRAALEETIDRIADNPTQFRLVRGETRRAILNRFPYAVYLRPAATTSSSWPSTADSTRGDGNRACSKAAKDRSDSSPLRRRPPSPTQGSAGERGSDSNSHPESRTASSDRFIDRAGRTRRYPTLLVPDRR